MAGQGQRSEKGSAGEVFQAFLKLGLTSFGGPVAHIGYFRAEIVAKRRWLSVRQCVCLRLITTTLLARYLMRDKAQTYRHTIVP